MDKEIIKLLSDIQKEVKELRIFTKGLKQQGNHLVNLLTFLKSIFIKEN